MDRTAGLVYECPHCRQVIEVDETAVDETVRCPNPECRKPFEIDPPEAEPVEAESLREDEISRLTADTAQNAAESEIGGAAEETHLVVHPSMFRASPFKFSGLLALAILGVAGIVASFLPDSALFIDSKTGSGQWPWLEKTFLLYGGGAITLVACGWLGGWWLKTRFVTLRITSVRSLLRWGIIARRTSEVRHRDVRNLQVNQNIFERLVGVGDIAISSAGQDDLEVVVNGIPRPEKAANLVRQMQ